MDLHRREPARGTGLDRCSRAHARLAGQDYVTTDNVRAVVHDVLRHRPILSYEASAEGMTADQVIRKIVKRVAVA